MNEQIRELAVKAYKEAAALGSQGVIPMSRVREVQFEKFAELIVKDCANIVNSLEQHEGPGDCATASYMKERFGVE